MSFDRSKFKATPINVLNAQREEAELRRPKGGSNIDYHRIDDGENVFRIYPAHPNENLTINPFNYPKSVSFLPLKRQKKDDKGNLIPGAFEEKRLPVFNAKVHGNLDKDIVEEYMKFAKDVAIPDFAGEDSEKFKEVWGMITGFKTGVKPSDTWMMYADKISETGNKKFGLLEIKPSVKDQMAELAAKFAAGDITSPDPFTDPDDGVCLVITKTGEGKDTRYKADLQTKKVDKLTTSFVPTPLSDDDLAVLEKATPLREMYYDSFKRSDFDKEMEGLQKLDTQLAREGYPIQVFSYDAFLDICEQISEMVPDDDEEEGSSPAKEEPAPRAEKEVGAERDPDVDEAPWDEDDAQDDKAVQADMRKELDEGKVARPSTSSIQDRLAKLKSKAGK